MRSLDFVVNSSEDRSLNEPIAVEVGLVSVTLNKTNAKLIKDNYDVIFTAGNSFGHMTGGFDGGLIDVFGGELQEAVTNMIGTYYGGMMPVGASEVVTVGKHKIVYTPTMMVPTDRVDPLGPYFAMHHSLRALALHALETDTYHDRILTPLFCTGTAKVPHETALFQQNEALVEFQKARNQESIGCNDLFEDGMKRYNELVRVR